MDYPEIINNFLHPFKPNLVLSDSLQQNLTQLSDLNNQIMLQYQIQLPNHILFEPHIMTGSIVFGIYFISDFIDILFWESHIKPFRNKIRDKIKGLWFLLVKAFRSIC